MRDRPISRLARSFALLAACAAAPRLAAQGYTFTHFVGAEGGAGAVDGTGRSASFDFPYAVAVLPNGDVVVADSGNAVLRRVSPSGAVSTFAGRPGEQGTTDGAAADARFLSPTGVVGDGSGGVFVSDSRANTIRRVTATGVVSAFAGTAGPSGHVDGAGAEARFAGPQGLARDAAGNLYVAELGQTIRKITPAGVVTTLAGSPETPGHVDGTGAAASFAFPLAVAVDAAGNVYVADGSHTIRKVTPEGVVSTLAGDFKNGPGFANGSGTDARFNAPAGIAIDRDGNLAVADLVNHVLRRVTPAGVVTTLSGGAQLPGSRDGAAGDARFFNPRGLALAADGALVVADAGNHAIRRVDVAGAVTTLAGSAAESGTADGAGGAARFNGPSGLAADATGNVYVTDARNHTIRKVTRDGVVTTIAGSPGVAGYADGAGSAARFQAPTGVGVAPDGSLVVADTNNHTIRRISPSGVVTTIAGAAGISGVDDGPGASARFFYPYAVVADASGALYVADGGGETIRRIGTNGAVTTLAGAPTIPGNTDGPGAQARFFVPRAIALDPGGDLWIVEFQNQAIRRMTPAGVVRTVVGSSAGLSSPRGIAVDAAGVAYVTDRYTIRRVTADGTVTTIGGVPFEAGGSDGTGAAARFQGPSGIAVDAAGRIFVSEVDGHDLRIGTPSLADAATIDAEAAPAGLVRRLGTSPDTSTSWQWQVVNRPPGSSASLSSSSARAPSFVPDAAGFYRFRLLASAGERSSISFVTLAAGPPLVAGAAGTSLVPIVLDVTTATAHFTTELTLTNRTSAAVPLLLTYTASLGGGLGSGSVEERLEAGEQKRIPDVIAALRARGLPIPADGLEGGTLLVGGLADACSDASRPCVAALARTATATRAPQPVGRAGLAYAAVPVPPSGGVLAPAGSRIRLSSSASRTVPSTESEAPRSEADSATALTVYALRSNASDRSNLALYSTGPEPVTLRVTIASAEGERKSVVVRAAEVLGPYGFSQVNSPELLDAHGIVNGIATVERVSGTGTFGAYGVVNDRGTDDGSFLLPASPGAAAAFTLPVLVETPSFRSELVLANRSASEATFALDYLESLAVGRGRGGTVLVTLGAGEQTILPEAIDYLRTHGAAIDAKGETSYAGAVRVAVSGDATAADLYVAARTASVSPAGGGFGLFTPAVASGQEAGEEAFVFGLAADAENRSNVAVVNAGGAGAGVITLRLQAYDGDAGGTARGEPLTVALEPGQWAQPPAFFAASGVRNGWVRATRVSGSAPWIAYGVVNDGGSPGERTGDGAYVPMAR